MGKGSKRGVGTREEETRRRGDAGTRGRGNAGTRGTRRGRGDGGTGRCEARSERGSPRLRVSPSPRLPFSASPLLRVSPSPRLPFSASLLLRVSFLLADELELTVRESDHEDA